MCWFTKARHSSNSSYLRPGGTEKTPRCPHRWHSQNSPGMRATVSGAPAGLRPGLATQHVPPLEVAHLIEALWCVPWSILGPMVDGDYREVQGPGGWVDSDYGEIPVEHRGGTVRRELFRVYRGRFCFRLGAGTRCGGPNAVTITAGRTEKLELSLSLGGRLPVIPIKAEAGATRGIEVTHTFSQQLGPWPVGPCDSVFPVLCFDDATLRQYRWKRPIRRYELHGLTDEFDHGSDPGWAAPNARRNDPFCDCHDRGSPTTIDGTRTPTSEVLPVITIARPIAFVPLLPADGHREDPVAAAEETAQAIDVILGHDRNGEEERSGSKESITGIARSDGAVIWLNAPASPGEPNLALIPWGVSSVERKLITFDRDLVPLVALGPPTESAYCELKILAQQEGDDELREIVRDQAVVRAESRFTVVWYEANFGDLPGGTTGVVELELHDASGEAVGYPVREPFVVDPLPAVRAPQPAGVW